MDRDRNTRAVKKDQTSFYGRLSARIHDFFYPPTATLKKQRNKTLINVTLFALSTIAMVAFRKRIYSLVTPDTAEIARTKFASSPPY